MTAPEQFEDRLLAQLRQVVAERPAPAFPPARRGPRRSRLIAAGAGGAAALAAVAIVASSGDVTSNAYAVEPGSDGDVTVQIHDLSDAAGLQQSLREAGIPAVVSYLPAGQKSCIAPPPLPQQGAGEHGTAVGGSLKKMKPGTETDGGLHLQMKQGTDEGPTFSTGGSPPPGEPGEAPGPKVGSKVTVTPDGATFTVSPQMIEPGQKLYITTQTGTVSTIGMAVAKTDPTQDCGGSE
jgi:hypothetical protein